MHFITFDNNKDYQVVKDFIKNNNISATCSNAKDLFAKEEARTAVENNLKYYPEFYYNEKFDVEELIEKVVNEISECYELDKVYECASNFVKTYLDGIAKDAKVQRTENS